MREHNNALLANFMLRFTGHRNGCSGKASSKVPQAVQQCSSSKVVHAFMPRHPHRHSAVRTKGSYHVRTRAYACAMCSFSEPQHAAGNEACGAARSCGGGGVHSPITRHRCLCRIIKRCFYDHHHRRRASPRCQETEPKRWWWFVRRLFVLVR